MKPFKNYYKFFFLYLVFSFNLFDGFSQQFVRIDNLEIPDLKKDEQFVCHLAYCLSYNETYEQSSWVAYELTHQELNGKISRTNHFLSDPAIKTKSAEGYDYMGKGYDRGHLAPAADMSWSQQAMNESFYYSNMSPQVPSFNRGIWENIEEFVRRNAKLESSLYVVTGPVLRKGLSVIGPNEVAVPEYFYKVLLVYKKDEMKGIGILIPNKDLDGPINKYAVSIDEVEKATGINFFPLLPDVIEKKLESSFSISQWKWDSRMTEQEEIDAGQQNVISEKTGASIRCIGFTKKGKRCKKNTTNTNSRCNLHQ